MSNFLCWQHQIRAIVRFFFFIIILLSICGMIIDTLGQIMSLKDSWHSRKKKRYGSLTYRRGNKNP